MLRVPSLGCQAQGDELRLPSLVCRPKVPGNKDMVLQRSCGTYYFFAGGRVNGAPKIKVYAG